MNDIELDMRNDRALSSAHERYLTPPSEEEPCPVCQGTGVVPDTETEQLYGDPCPEGCCLDIRRIREQGRG